MPFSVNCRRQEPPLGRDTALQFRRELQPARKVTREECSPTVPVGIADSKKRHQGGMLPYSSGGNCSRKETPSGRGVALQFRLELQPARNVIREDAALQFRLELQTTRNATREECSSTGIIVIQYKQLLTTGTKT